jgi:hypothetical protein
MFARDAGRRGAARRAGRPPATQPNGGRHEQSAREQRPGRVALMDVAELAGLLRETAEHHGAFEAVAPPHDWWDWYAAYMDARQSGSSSEDAVAAAGRYMADVKHIVVSPA